MVDRTSTQRQFARFTLRTFSSIKIATHPSYRIKGILPRDGLAVVWGPPKCGKSFWVFDLVMHVALNRPYRGRKVQAGPVVYLALEGGAGFANRIEAWRQRYLSEDHDPEIPFYLLDVALDLVAEHRALIQTIRAQVTGAPVIVVIDTLNRAIKGDENASSDMTKFIDAADTIRAAFDCLVVIVHHCGINGNRPRGHTSLSGADAAQIAIERDDDGTIRATVEHGKDFEAGAVVTSKLESIDLGEDTEGDPVTSCVIVETQAGPATPAAPKLSKNQKRALNILTQMIREMGLDAPAEAMLPLGSRVCLMDAWRNRFYASHQADKQDTKKRAFTRAVQDLADEGLVGIWQDFAFIPERGGVS